ncbi:DUF805 domain-containing protein [Lactococcus sp.]|uniref:DUF805 domain-containing protein n=1 Tax=Lactococcus sp. TaxID=44273 RepID=UPI002FCAD985
MIQAYKKFWQGTFVFNKRTNRKDFWMALFIHLIIFVILLKGYNFFNFSSYFQLPLLWQAISSLFLWLFWLYFLGSLLAYLALTVRRLNDADLPWGLVFLNLIFVLGTIVLLVLNLFPSSLKGAKFQPFELKRKSAFIASEEPKGFSEMFKDYFKNYFEFRGNASRRNFWWVQIGWGALTLIFIILIYASGQFDQVMFGRDFIGTVLLKLVFILFLIGSFMPELTIHVRRLRDVGLSDLGLSILLGVTAGMTILYRIFANMIKMTYSTSHYQLFQYLMFLLVMICWISLIIIELMASGELKKVKKIHYL